MQTRSLDAKINSKRWIMLHTGIQFDKMIKQTIRKTKLQIARQNNFFFQFLLSHQCLTEFCCLVSSPVQDKVLFKRGWDSQHVKVIIFCMVELTTALEVLSRAFPESLDLGQSCRRSTCISTVPLKPVHLSDSSKKIHPCVLLVFCT